MAASRCVAVCTGVGALASEAGSLLSEVRSTSRSVIVFDMRLRLFLELLGEPDACQ